MILFPFQNIAAERAILHSDRDSVAGQQSLHRALHGSVLFHHGIAAGKHGQRAESIQPRAVRREQYTFLPKLPPCGLLHTAGQLIEPDTVIFVKHLRQRQAA